MDILYEPDFSVKYADLWRIRGEFEDLGRIDLRWLALFQVVLAFGALLSASSPEEEKEFAAMSSRFFDCARRALSEAPTYRGESMDTVRAYALVRSSCWRLPSANASYRCTSCLRDACRRHGTLSAALSARLRRKGELVLSPCRRAHYRFHVDGQVWNLPPKEAELRRRLWARKSSAVQQIRSC